jgi:hypothetical protein
MDAILIGDRTQKDLLRAETAANFLAELQIEEGRLLR